jgi:hypothetical protein
MIDRETRRYAANLDRVRHRRGPAGSLFFLGFTGAHDFTVKLEVTAGWFAEVKKRRESAESQGKPVYLSIEVAALDGNDLTPLLKEEWRVSVAGIVYTIDKDHLTPPVVSPLVWLVQAYHTDDRFTPPPPTP